MNHLSPTERRFASSFFADTSAAGVRATRAEMHPDGRMTSWIWIAAIDVSIMLKLGVLMSDQLAGGVTDVVLDCADVVVVEKLGLAALASVASQVKRELRNRRDPSSHGTLSIEHASADVVERIEPLVACGLVAIQHAVLPYPSTPHAADGFEA